MIGLYDIEDIVAMTGTLSIVRSNNERDTKCAFSTLDAVREWDEIIVENDYGERLFGGILESPTIDKTDAMTIHAVESRGYKKLLDRGKVEEAFEDGELAGDDVRAILTEYAPDFSDAGVEDGPEIGRVLFNHALVSECMQRIADAIGYQWRIDAYKVVTFAPSAAETAPRHLTADEDFFAKLKIDPDTSNLANVVIVRGGTYRSEEVIYTEIADGEKTKFVLPEKPHDVTVYVNSSLQTLGVKFGEQDATNAFQLNYNEKYIENGTAATLTAGDVFEVRYTYDVPIRVRVKDRASIAALAVLFPGTNGEFVKYIDDKDIVSRDVAYATANQYLTKYSNAVVSASYETTENIVEPGQVQSIDVPGFTGSSVVQSITSRSIGGGLWKHSVKLSTVLFGFEEFMRTLLAAKKVELIDGEVLETSTEVDDTFAISETLTASVTENLIAEGGTVADEEYAALNAGIEFVLGPYYPANFADTKRVFCLDASPLG